jgi:hypothetical protein
MMEAQAARRQFPPGVAHSVRFVSRRQYRKVWSRSLGLGALESRSAGKG